MEKLQVAVIGTGGIADLHMQSYHSNDRVEIYAICDLNEERARQKANQYKAAKAYTDYKRLLADPAVDAVSICTWNNTHAEISIAALQAGKNVLVEKPLTTNIEDAHKIEAAVTESGKKLQVGFVRRYDDNIQMLKKFIDGGDLGDLYYAKASNIRRIGNPGGWFADSERSGGGPLIDIGIHMIDVCWYLMGSPNVVSVSGNTYHQLGNRSNIQNLSSYRSADYDPNKNDVEDMATAFVRFDNNASLMIDASYTLHAKQEETSVKLFGNHGGIEVEPELTLVTEKYDTVLNAVPQVDNHSLDIAQAFKNEIDRFVAYCFGEQETLSPIADGVEMMKILRGIYDSAEKGAEVQFPQRG